MTAIVIPYGKSIVNIEKALQSVAKKPTQKSSDVFIVLNNYSKDHIDQLKNLQASFSFNVIYNKKTGVSAARNYARTLNDYDSILFMDADCSLKPEALREVVEHFQKNNFDILSSPYLPPERGKYTWSFAEYSLDNNHFKAEISNNHFFNGAFFFCKPEVIREHCFNESLLASEDAEWFSRASKNYSATFYRPIVLHNKLFNVKNFIASRYARATFHQAWNPSFSWSKFLYFFPWSLIQAFKVVFSNSKKFYTLLLINEFIWQISCLKSYLGSGVKTNEV